VHGLAAGGEGAGDGDEDDLLAGELLAGVVGLGKAAGGGGGVGDRGPAVRRKLCQRSALCSKIWWMQDAYSNLTSEGNLSPALMGAIVMIWWVVGGEVEVLLCS
jgi:hypothetical protein